MKRGSRCSQEDSAAAGNRSGQPWAPRSGSTPVGSSGPQPPSIQALLPCRGHPLWSSLPVPHPCTVGLHFSWLLSFAGRGALPPPLSLSVQHRSWGDGGARPLPSALCACSSQPLTLWLQAPCRLQRSAMVPRVRPSASTDAPACLCHLPHHHLPTASSTGSPTAGLFPAFSFLACLLTWRTSQEVMLVTLSFSRLG